MAVTRTTAQAPTETVLGERRGTRAAAMPADERRAAIIAATLPLLMQHGSAITTRQIAESAGIAEGTIFRVFPDKDTLVAAAVEAALDPGDAEAALTTIDLSLPLEPRLVAGVEIIQRRLRDIWRLFTAVGIENVKNRSERRRTPGLAGLSALFEPDRAAIDREPAAAAHILNALTLAMSHPMLTSDEPHPATEIVSVFLDGVRAKPPAPATRAACG